MSPAWRGLFATGRAPALPPEVRAAVGRRVLAGCRDAEGGWLLGTRDELVHVASAVRRWPWQELLRAEWDQDAEQVTVVPVGDFGRPVDTVTLQLVDAADLLGLVRERVSASIVLQQRVPVSGSRGFLVFARRAPSGGPLSWAFELDEGVDPEDPEVRRRLDEALAQAQASLGDLA